VLRFSFLTDTATDGRELEPLTALATALALTPTYVTEKHRILAAVRPGLGRLVVSWERHTEFIAYTLFVYELRIPFAPFGFDMTTLLPPGWLARVGHPLLGLRLTVGKRSRMPRTHRAMMALFEEHTVNASQVMGGRAAAWTCYRVHEDGLGRVAVVGDGLSVQEVGRIAERLLAIEDLYHLTLLSQDFAREAKPLLRSAEERLSAQATKVRRADTVEAKRAVLDDLLDLAAEVENVRSRCSYRFAASSAYFDLLENRFAELREVKLPGVLSLSRFLMRRLRPAAHAYRDIVHRLSHLSDRIDRVAELLRTSIELGVEQQNLALLAQVDRSVGSQLRLREAIETLSVVVLTYYALEILGFALRGAARLGLDLDVELALALAIPVLLTVVYLITHAIKQHSREPVPLR
jgi:uncharacterized membrane-anchored protein